MSQHVKRSYKCEGKHLLRVYMLLSGRFRREAAEQSVPQVKRMHKCVGNGGKFVKTLSSWTLLWGRGPLFEFQ